MKKKVGTFLEEQTLIKVKKIAAKEGKKLNQVFEEAIKEYALSKGTENVVKETKAVFKINKNLVKAILEEEFYEF